MVLGTLVCEEQKPLVPSTKRSLPVVHGYWGESEKQGQVKDVERKEGPPTLTHSGTGEETGTRGALVTSCRSVCNNRTDFWDCAAETAHMNDLFANLGLCGLVLRSKQQRETQSDSTQLQLKLETAF